MFNKSNLEGKQIWCITAPASVPISSIGSTALRDMEKGGKVLTYNHNDYRFTQDATDEKAYFKIMNPNSSDDGYHTGI
jgi:hypothetical protein